MPDRLSLSVDSADGVCRIEVDGELDLTTIGQLADIATAAIGEGNSVVLDCEGLRFIDSTGLSTLVEIHQSATDAGVSLQLESVPSHALRLMQITKIDALLGL